MKHYVGLDVSLKETAVCVVDENGVVIREGKAFSDPEAIIAWLNESGLSVAKVGLEIVVPLVGSMANYERAAYRRSALTPVDFVDSRRRCRSRPIVTTHARLHR